MITRINSLPPYVYKSSMANLCQTEGRSKILRTNGSLWCGPTAVANTLIYLSRQYFQMMVPPVSAQSELQAEAKLVETLAKYMKSNDEGTSPLNVMSGLEKYVRERGYRALIEWQGRFNGGCYETGKIPDPQWVMQGTVSGSNAILNIGGYKFISNRLLYRRIKGHYLTVAGLRSKKNELIIHDPAQGSRGSPLPCSLNRLVYGSLSKWKSTPSCAARGYHKLLGVYLPSEEMETAVIDGAFVFKVSRR